MMPDEVFVKNVELAGSKKAAIKSKWRKHEDLLDVEIYVREDLSVYIGSCSQELLRKKKEINVKFETIKSALTSGNIQDNISYELDEKKLKFLVVAQESFDSDASFDSIIYLKIDITKVEPTNLASIMIQTIDDMSASLPEVIKLKAEKEQHQEELSTLQLLLEQAMNEKTEFDKTIYQKFNALLNSKKRRISELEHKLDKANHSNKFMNLSSDLDQSDRDRLSVQNTVEKTTPQKKPKPIGSSQSSDDFIQSQKPSTSKYISPARSRNSRNNSRSGSKNNSPSSQRTPKKLSLSSRKALFQFKSYESDDSDDELPLKKPQADPNNEDMFSGLSIKISQKKFESQELNPSSEELLIPNENSINSLNAESPKTLQRSPELVQPAQEMSMDVEIHADDKKKKEDPKPISSEDLFKTAEDEPFTQTVEDENSQPLSQALESPSIFDTYSKRKLSRTSDSISKRTRLGCNKSKFSVDTVNILLTDSP